MDYKWIFIAGAIAGVFVAILGCWNLIRRLPRVKISVEHGKMDKANNQVEFFVIMTNTGGSDIEIHFSKSKASLYYPDQGKIPYSLYFKDGLRNGSSSGENSKWKSILKRRNGRLISRVVTDLEGLRVDTIQVKDVLKNRTWILRQPHLISLNKWISENQRDSKGAINHLNSVQ
ncbi:MAG: hypothetical protein KJ621_14285 [Proteobacteria bacterium]|nr:hypothetical protein [Pseudomonadota bacterium]